ncbi:MAG: hypothetical protein ACRC92_12075 [Peptostreptococcaceae bacterium]
MSKKQDRKTNKQLLQEARQEGMFKEAEEMAKTKKVYKIASVSDGILIAIILFLGIIVFTLTNHFFGV